jgi:RNA polymerase sigma-70 factor (ECF subfamily)
MLRFIGGFRPPSKSFQAWLYQIARNLATDHFRKTGTQQDIELEEHMFVDQQGSEAAVEKILTSDRLRQALNQLPDEQREVVTLRFVANMPIAEVASTLHKSEDAVKGLQRRSLIALRQILDAWEISYE